MASVSGMVGTVRERWTPAAETFEGIAREGQRVLAHGQQAAEDATDMARLRIRRQPFATVFSAAAVGAVLGLAVGAAVAYYAGRCASARES